MMISAILFLYMSFLHPLHLSVCDIQYSEQHQRLEISHRLFADDLESVLRPKLGAKTDLFNPKNPEQISEAIGQYLMEHFHLKLNDEALTPVYLGYELEEDVIWAYFEIPNVQQPKNLQIQNTVLFELFDDQLNLINLKTKEGIRSLKLVTDKKEGTLQF